jgi:hypothetical protein
LKYGTNAVYGTANPTSTYVKYGFKAASKSGGNSSGNVNAVWVETANIKDRSSVILN